ncbi:MAG: hypothetical protein CMF38_07505 [Legionellaceae bacterium]|nr:hypothetical protein [Legionellaceae bacterium]MBJ16459.1 hypothetical protein [Legionellaceae bacterium]HAF87930.1 hypothetical protein [Legionellales bacterium]HCA89793.1 hypothetical protein [Legionellales bacterium]|tara:strand:+ start:763 stop:1728 length:966 start_codon:yes stop_codon:yes gene_type:complete
MLVSETVTNYKKLIKIMIHHQKFSLKKLSNPELDCFAKQLDDLVDNYIIFSNKDYRLEVWVKEGIGAYGRRYDTKISQGAHLNILMIDFANPLAISSILAQYENIDRTVGSSLYVRDGKILLIGLNASQEMPREVAQFLYNKRREIFYAETRESDLTNNLFGQLIDEALTALLASLNNTKILPRHDTEKYEQIILGTYDNASSLSCQSAEPTLEEISAFTNDFRKKYRELTPPYRQTLSLFKFNALNMLGCPNRGTYDTWSLRDIIGFVVNEQANDPTLNVVKALNWFDEQGNIHPAAPQAVRYYHAELVEQLNQQNGPSL